MRLVRIALTSLVVRLPGQLLTAKANTNFQGLERHCIYQKNGLVDDCAVDGDSKPSHGGSHRDLETRLTGNWLQLLAGAELRI